MQGDVGDGQDILVRVHSECLTGDTFGSLRCDCGQQLEAAMAQIEKAGCGILLYMRQEGRGIGLINKLKAYKLQEQGQDTVEANISLGFAPDLRNYGVGAQIILDLGFNNFSLITNNPKKIVGLKGYGLKIHDNINIKSEVTLSSSECEIKEYVPGKSYISKTSFLYFLYPTILPTVLPVQFPVC